VKTARDLIDSQLIEHCLAPLVKAGPEPSRLYVGYSGGLDSCVLLHMLRQYQCKQVDPIELIAIHVNHQLMPQAHDWQQHCQQVCAEWGINLLVETVAVDQVSASLEQSARQARYGAFGLHVTSNDVLLLAHHRDDQVETLLQRLARGSGPLGLGAMAEQGCVAGMTILRPLLSLDRVTLQRYAQQHALRWVDDPSNHNDAMERNFVRNQLLPLWRQYKPQLNQSLARSARLCRESAGLLDQLAAMDLGAPRSDGGLPIALLQDKDRSRQANLLRYWIRQNGAPLPSETVLSQILDDAMTAAEDAQPQVDWGAISLRRYQGALYLLMAPTDSDRILSAQPIHHVEIQSADRMARLQLEHGVLYLQPDADNKLEHVSLFSKAALHKGALTLRFRAGGERLKPVGRPSKTLKDCFQEASVPPWQRAGWPILYCDEQIAGLPGLLVCEGFQPGTGQGSEQDVITIAWQWA
jgi:tRNA(Ile)-lysidine synthase